MGCSPAWSISVVSELTYPLGSSCGRSLIRRIRRPGGTDCRDAATPSPQRPSALHGGPHRVLVDKIGLLDGVTFPLL